MKSPKLHLPWLVLILAVSLLLTRHFWGTRGWIETHDGIFHVIRLEEFTAMFRLGYFPVRWAGNLDNGFGLPLFNYIYPLPYYLGLPGLLAGIPAKWVVKFLSVGFFALGALGVYAAFARRRRSLAALAALLFLTTPYLLLNLFVRGALGELMAISLIPWVYVAWQDLKTKGFKWYHPLPYFFLFLAHNFISFLFLPLYALLALSSRSTLRPVLQSLLVSLGLASFFLIPMLVERGLVYSGASLDFTYNFRDHFVYPLQLLSGKWDHGHSVEGSGDGLSFALGLPYLAILVLAAWRTPRLLLLPGSVLLFLLPPGRLLWELLSPLQVIQFPWRLLALTTVLLPFLAFHTLIKFKSFLLSVVLLLIGLVPAWYYSTPAYLMNNEQFAREIYIHREKTTTSSRLELLPRWSDQVERWRGAEDLRIISGNAQLVLTSSHPLSLTLISSTADPATRYQIRRNYFPSWQAADETGHPLALTSSDLGEIILTPALGSHTYTIWVDSTPVEKVANWLTLLFALYLLSRALNPLFKKYLDKRYQDWDLSIALRYLPIAVDLKKRRQKSEQVLEVGSEITGITPYLKQKITGLDQGFDYTRRNPYLTPVKGSATKMPFPAQTFAYCLCVDVLEHIPPGQRAAAVSEMLRVTGKRIYLSFPCGSTSETVDRQLDAYFFDKFGTHYDYLSEHVQNGLPSPDLIPTLIAKSRSWNLTATVGNTSLWLWTLLLKLGLSNTPWKTSLYHRLLLLTPVLRHCNFGRTYRRLYIIDRV